MGRGAKTHSYLRMWLMGVNPHSVYWAEKMCRESDIEIERAVLVQHHLAGGNLGGLVARLTSPRTERTGDWIAREVALDLAESTFLEVDSGKIDRIENPFIAGAGASVAILGFAGIGAAGTVLRSYGNIQPITWIIVAVMAVGIVAACFSYTYSAASIGKKKTEKIFCALIITGLVVSALAGGVWFLSR